MAGWPYRRGYNNQVDMPAIFVIASSSGLILYENVLIMSAKTNTSIRHKLYDYIRFSDDKQLYAIYNLLRGDRGNQRMVER